MVAEPGEQLLFALSTRLRLKRHAGDCHREGSVEKLVRIVQIGKNGAHPAVNELLFRQSEL